LSTEEEALFQIWETLSQDKFGQPQRIYHVATGDQTASLTTAKEEINARST